MRAWAGMDTRQQATPRWRAYTIAGVSLQKSHSFGRHTVDVGGRNTLLAIAAKIAVAEVVGQDENNVRAKAGHLLG